MDGAAARMLQAQSTLTVGSPGSMRAVSTGTSDAGQNEFRHMGGLETVVREVHLVGAGRKQREMEAAGGVGLRLVALVGGSVMQPDTRAGKRLA